MVHYILTKVESFLDDDVRWEVTDPQYKGEGSKVIATFVDGNDARIFMSWKTEQLNKLRAAVKPK